MGAEGIKGTVRHIWGSLHMLSLAPADTPPLPLCAQASSEGDKKQEGAEEEGAEEEGAAVGQQEEAGSDDNGVLQVCGGVWGGGVGGPG